MTAFGRQPLRRCPAQTTGTARDQGDFPTQIEIHTSSTVRDRVTSACP